MNPSDIMIHSVHWGVTLPPQKNTTPLFLAKPPLNWQTVQGPLFRHFPPLYWFFVNPNKSRIFQ